MAGITILIIVLSIPLAGELEILIKKTKKLPGLMDVIRLKHTRKERWLKFYAVFLAIVLALLALALYAYGPKSLLPSWSDALKYSGILVYFYLYTFMRYITVNKKTKQARAILMNELQILLRRFQRNKDSDIHPADKRRDDL